MQDANSDKSVNISLETLAPFLILPILLAPIETLLPLKLPVSTPQNLETASLSCYSPSISFNFSILE